MHNLFRTKLRGLLNRTREDKITGKITSISGQNRKYSIIPNDGGEETIINNYHNAERGESYGN